MVRSDDDLRAARWRLFQTFPFAGDAMELFRFQRALAEEILRTEAEQRQTKGLARRDHIRAVRIYGDALAHTLLSRYSLRQLSRNTGKPPHLSGQGAAFQSVLASAEAVAAEGAPVLLPDLTNVVRNADLLLCSDPDLPLLVEHKSSKVKKTAFERQGRRGRQLARLSSIGNFLRTGRGRIFGEKQERRTIDAPTSPRYSYAEVDKIVVSALRHEPVTLALSPNEIVSAARDGQRADSASAMASLKVSPGDHMAVGNSLDPLRDGIWEAPPPVLWDISPDARWAIMEGDVVITHAMRVEALVGAARGDICIVGVTDGAGVIPWTYQLATDSGPLTISANVVLDVVYAHQTVESATEEMLGLARLVIDGRTFDGD
jgi:hypothetical protein